MKAAPFAYVRPATLDDAVAELVRSAGEGKVLAGGQSLVPILAMRLARPSTVVDIGALSELDFVRREGDELVIGALVRQRALEGHPLAAAVPLLRLALPWIGHRELRSRGTVCGSIAHADPAAELPAVACCLGASLEIAGRAGRRTVAAAEFFHGAMATSVGAEDVLAAVRFPVARPGEGFGFGEIARRHGDFALAGVATRFRAEDGEAVLTAFGVSDRPVTRDITGLGDDDVAGLARGLVDTAGDTHGSREYRQRLVAALAVRELARARRAAEGGSA
ncbi:FAD binding domain-containing protein [Amycolatopsis sp. NPDC023774]|uniref:FAD binding domain-containing protein n=1 Tax=Amycolatopsis sp. NPDC023774 TaxID=3155015 RepID=UPI0033C95B31